MSLTSDLINISPLVGTDTFNTWVNRTNQIIEEINPLQVYDVEVGTTGGLLKQTGISAGNYNGVVTISVNSGPGVGTWTLGGQSRTVLDFSKYDTYGLNLTGGASGDTSSVAANDEYAVNDISDTQQSSYGTVKKVRARNMLPYQIDGDHSFGGNIIIYGNLTVEGTDAFIAANNLRIEDKQIELAYQRAIALTLTGVTGGTFLPSSIGVTAYHFADSSGLTPDIYGHFQSYTGSAIGPTGSFVIGSLFQDPYDADDFEGRTGYISLGPTGTTRYRVVGNGSPFTSFLSDDVLSEGGFVLKGASGDKTLLWIYTDTDSGLRYNAWVSNTNLGVTGDWNGIISRVFRSHGFSADQSHSFISTPGSNTVIYLTEAALTITSSSGISGGWGITRKSTSEPNTLVFKYSDTNIHNSSRDSFSVYGSITSAGGTGSKWRAFPTVTANNFGYQLNVDQLDGAHGYTQPAPYSIPISDEYGLINGDWLESSALRRKVYQVSHGLTFGTVVRIDSSGNYTGAIASNSQYGESIGIVSSVSGNNFVVTLKGKISGMSGAVQTVEGSAFTPGSVYFLSAGITGKLISDPDLNVLTKIPEGGVRKAIYLASSATEGYVLNYVGSVVNDFTDELYLEGLVPTGTIIPFSGSQSYITEEWLICNGNRYRKVDYPDLATILSDAYYANITITAHNLTSGVIEDGPRNLVVGDRVNLVYNNTTYTRTIAAINSSSNILYFDTSLSAANYQLKPSTNSSSEDIFFVPDLRSRFIRGWDTTTSIGALGGSAETQLTGSNLPQHRHGLDLVSTNALSGAGLALVQGGSVTDTLSAATGSATPFSNIPPYLLLYYLVRAKQRTKATILTGHDHDLRYIRYNGTHDSSSGLTEGGRTRFRENALVSGIALGSSLSAYGPTHDHDLRYVRFDGSQSLSAGQKYQARTNISAAGYAEGDGLSGIPYSLTHNHDFIYVRYDGLAQSPFDNNETVKSNFRYKLGVLSSDEVEDNYVNQAGDIMTGTLTMYGNNLADILMYNSSGNIIFYAQQQQELVQIYDKLYINGNNGKFIIYGSETTNPFVEANAQYRQYIIDIDSAAGAAGDGYFAVQRQGNNVFAAIKVDNNSTSTDSNSQVYAYGDFTVFSDGLTTSALAAITTPTSQVATFAVDPHLGRILVGGRQLRSNGTYVLGPTINLVEGSDYNTPSTHGMIRGLTLPTEGNNAANKDYVDQQNSVFRCWALGSNPSGLTSNNGLYLPLRYVTSTGLDASSNSIVITGSVPYGNWKFTLDYSLIDINTSYSNAGIYFSAVLPDSSAVVTSTSLRNGNSAKSGTLSLIIPIPEVSSGLGTVSLYAQITDDGEVGGSSTTKWMHVDFTGIKVGTIYGKS